MVGNSKFLPWHGQWQPRLSCRSFQAGQLDSVSDSPGTRCFLWVFAVQLWHSKGLWGLFPVFVVGILPFWIVLHFSLQWGDEGVAELQLAIVLKNTPELPFLLQLTEKPPLSWLDLSLIIGHVFLSFSELLHSLPYQYCIENVLSWSLLRAVKVRDDGSLQIHISVWPLYA